MTRIVKDFMLTGLSPDVTDPIAYREDFDGDWQAPDYGSFKRTVGLKCGDVVWIERCVVPGQPGAIRARVLDFWPERDRGGFWRPKFRVQPETKQGTWSKIWEYTWAGHIQRGYRNAGWIDEFGLPVKKGAA